MEIWKDVKGYENLYQISSEGRLKRKKRYQIRRVLGKEREYPLKEMIIKPDKNSVGYLRYTLHDNRRSKRELAHRLVAEAFIGDSDDLHVVNHKDGDKKNNKLYNLEYVTRSENSKHSIHVLGNTPVTTGINRPREVQKIDIDTGKVLKEYKTVTEAHKDTGVYHISSVCRGKRCSAGGFLWRYKY